MILAAEEVIEAQFVETGRALVGQCGRATSRPLRLALLTMIAAFHRMYARIRRSTC